ncbi:MAG: hypothetical protein CM15mP68_0030 [Pseudomonadota bacterium]|nr:MAG: hypothetical protein CM15mP68_0030 [Pseudomonadota bacterium]
MQIYDPSTTALGVFVVSALDVQRLAAQNFTHLTGERPISVSLPSNSMISIAAALMGNRHGQIVPRLLLRVCPSFPYPQE